MKTMPIVRPGVRMAAGAGLLLLAAACGEEPAAPEAVQREAGAPAAPMFSALLACSVDVAAGSMNCDPADGPSGAAGGPQMNLIVGSQHQFVRLANSTPTVDGDVWSANVTVQNLTLQPFATSNGVSHNAAGVRIFFVDEPNNGVVVSNHDGTAAFTGSEGQKYYEYSGTALGADRILTSGEVSSAKRWEFALNGAEAFRFSVLVSTVVPDPGAIGVHLTRVAAGSTFSCGEGSNGKLYCWGYNGSGQLGIESIVTTQSTTPLAVTAPTGVTLSRAVTGGGHACAEGSDGNAYCWGSGTSGQLGTGQSLNQTKPRAVKAPDSVTLTAPAVGTSHTCAEGSNGKAYCWGNNNLGQLGIGATSTALNTPVAVKAPDSVVLTGLAVGWYHACAEGSDGKAYCWGRNSFGQLGDASSTQRSAPVEVQAPEGVTLAGLVAGQNHTCAVGSDDKVYCWGQNNNGQLGDGTTTNRNTPTPVKAPAGVTLSAVTTHDSHTCALGSDGNTYCWGYNPDGRLGTGDTDNRNEPAAVSKPAGITFTAVAAGDSHTCALGSNGRTYCWGFNGQGRLGDGTTTDRPTPVGVAGTVGP